MSVAFTDEQRAAIGDRAGSALLAANAGSGKTAVMAERCVEAGKAIVRDYKGASAPKGAGWAEGGALQVALYMLAARELLGLEPVGGLYQALWARDPRPRGLVRDDVPGRYVSTDVVDEPALETALDEVRERALETAAALQAGRVSACPERCSPKGCAYPTICRAGG